MNANVNRTNNGKRLAVAVAIFVMLACCLAVVIPSEDVNAAAPTYADNTDIQRGDLATTVATVSFYDNNGDEWDYNSGNTVPITNSSLGNTNLNIIVDSTNTNVVTISGNLMGQATGSQFDMTGAPSAFDYGFVFNLADIVDAEGDYGFGAEGATVYIGYTNVAGEWKVLPKTGSTSTQLVYINAERASGSTIYYISSSNMTSVENTTGAQTFTVKYDFTLIPYGTYDNLVYRGDISTQNATVSLIDSVGAEWDYKSGNTEPITNSSLGNTNMNIVRDSATSVTISGVLNNQTGNAQFTGTGAPDGFEYGFVFNLADVVDSTGSYGFGAEDATVYIGYTNAAGEWKVLPKTGSTSTQLVYIDGERATGSTTYYFSDKTIAEGETDGLASFTVNYNFTLKSTVDADSVSEAMGSESDIIIFNGTSALSDPLTVAEGKTFIIDARYLPETTTLSAGAVLTLGDVTSINNTKGKTIEFEETSTSTGATVVLGNDFTGTGVSIIQGSIEISGQDLSGIITVSGDVKVTDLLTDEANTGSSTEGLTINTDESTLQTVTVDDNISVNKPTTGAGLILGENISFDATGRTIILNGTSSSDLMIEMGATTQVNYLSVNSIEGTGTIHVPRGATLIYNTISSSVVIDAEEGAIIKAGNGQGTENEISESQSITGNQYLSDNTTILEGVTLTVPRNAVLDLAGYNLIVYGTIEVQAGGTIISSVDRNNNTGTIVLMTGGSIVNNGTIGTDRDITVQNGANTAQTVVMKQVNGVNFEIVRSGTGTARTYDMAISGDVSRISGASDPTIEITNVDINKDLTIGRNVTFTVNGETVVASGVTVTNGGALMNISGTGFLMMNGATLIVNSHITGTVYIDVGTVQEGNNVVGTDGSVTFTDTTDASAGYVTGMTITSGRVTLPDPMDSTKSIVYQRMYLSGNLDAIATTGADGRPSNTSPVGAVNIAGVAFISESLVVPDDVELTINGYFDVSSAGTLTVAEGQTSALDYFGAKYIVETTVNADTTETTYYTSFDSAMTQIATAVEQTIYVSGDFTISGTYTLAEGQAIELDSNADADTGVIVGESSVITVDADADVNSNAFGLIEGRVIVLEGTGYKPAVGAGIYAVVTVDSATNDTTYSGFKVALDNATSGQTITVVDDATYRGNMVVPANVTVDVDDGWTLTVTGNVTIQQDGTLLLGDGSGLVVGTNGRDATITVNGTLTAEGATIGATVGANVDLYSTGTTTVDSLASFENVGYNAAVYVDVETVLTSVSAAVDYAEQNALSSITLYGTFTDSAAVDSDGIDIIVATGAVVSMGDVTLNDASISVTGTGVYTANVSGLSGAGDAAVTSTVSVNRTSATIASVVVLNAEGVNQYSMTIDAIVNSTQFIAGTFEIVGDANTGTVDIELEMNGDSMTIVSGATVLVGEGAIANISGGDYLINNGTILIEGTVNIDGNTTIGGTVTVAEEGTLEISERITLAITGTVTVDDNGEFEVSGTLQIGETPSLLSDTTTGSVSGDVTLVGNAYVIVYSGGSVADAVIGNAADDDLKSTAYTINGIEFATVYLTGIQGLNIVNNAVDDLDDLNITADGVVWYSGSTIVSDSTTNNNIGTYSEVTAEIRYNSVEINISVGSQISVVVDGVVIGSSIVDYPLTIGTHTVSAIVNPGFSGDVTITFNGQAVTNGEIEITSDMINSINDIVLSATGNITQDQSVVNVDGGNSEMGLTDYLLIILVVLIVIMAIMVAMRLMRS